MNSNVSMNPSTLPRLWRRIPRITVMAVVLVLSSGMIVSASIPDSGTGLVSACMAKSTGAVRLIDAQAGEACKKGEALVTWNQTGPKGEQGDRGPQGLQGPKGEPGPAGGASLASLQDTACTRHGGGVGYVDITIDATNTIVMACAPGIPHWCDTHTPDTGPHLNVTCDELADSLSFVCDVGWVNLDTDIANGCEVEGFEPTHQAITAFANSVVIGPHDVPVVPNCDPNATITVGCVNGQPVDPAPFVHVVGSNLGIQDIAPNQFGISLDLAISTPTGIPIAGAGLTCQFNLDTSAGTFPTATLTGRLDFVVNAQTGVTDRIQTSQANLGQFEAADISISGGVGCAIANVFTSFALDTIRSTLESYLNVDICRGPDPDIFVACPPN